MSDNNKNQQSQPSLMGGHAQWVKGAAETTIGNISGSHAWKSSGEQDKAAGVAVMKKASETRDETQGYGRVEELAGQATGCEGMRKEGAASKRE